MTEIDLRSDNRNPGIPLDPFVVGRDIYRLLAIFGASREIAARRSGEDDKGSVYGYSIRAFELSEVGRLLVSLAAGCRNDWDRRAESIDDTLAACAESSEVGVLFRDIRSGEETQLHVRESWHKILHCDTMNFDRSEGPSICSGHLEPFVHLYGGVPGAELESQDRYLPLVPSRSCVDLT